MWIRAGRSLVAKSGLAFCVLAFGVAPATVPDAKAENASVREMRQHYTLQSADRTKNFAATVIDRLSETRTSTQVLLADSRGRRFLLTCDRDFVHHTSVYEIRQVGGAEFVRYTLSLPYSARTLAAMLEEAHAHPELLNDRNAHFELAAVGNAAFSGGVDSWKDEETATQWRSRARLMLSPSFIDDLEQLETAGVFRVPELLYFDGILLPLVLYRTECPPKELPAVLASPDCDFDKRFGFACSDVQKERAKKPSSQSKAY